jgi:hypothetical protein
MAVARARVVGMLRLGVGNWQYNGNGDRLEGRLRLASA